jgi:hypothetical protein
MTPFLKLEDLLAPLPLPPVIAVLMVLGLVALGRRLVRLLNLESPEPIHYAAGFVVSAALLAAASHFTALAGLAYIWPLRLAAWLLAVLGLVHCPRIIREWLLPAWQQTEALFQTESPWGRTALLLLGITGLALLLAALGPASDADSLDYHLGVPLQVLRQHGIVYRPDWFLARLAGPAAPIILGPPSNTPACWPPWWRCSPWPAAVKTRSSWPWPSWLVPWC